MQGLRRRVAVTVPSFPAAAHIVASSDLIATLPQSVAERAERLDVELRPPPLELPRGVAAFPHLLLAGADPVWRSCREALARFCRRACGTFRRAEPHRRRLRIPRAVPHRPGDDADRGRPGDLARRPEPSVTVATLRTPAQDPWSPESVAARDKGLSFSPWHGLASHRPPGGVMRARNSTYASSADFRSRHNGCPSHEPKSL